MCGLLVCLFVGLFGCVSALSASALAPSATLRPSVFSSFFLSLRRRGGGSCVEGEGVVVWWEGGRKRRGEGEEGVTTRGRQLACKSWVHVCSLGRCERWRSGGDGRWRSWELGEGEKKEKTKRKNKSTKRHLHLFSLPKIAPQHQPSDAGSVRGHNKLCAKPKLAASPPR
ncbi:MAG: hypothetical protein ACKERG_03820 [Candidatus Hodgkinia cicadicola]